MPSFLLEVNNERKKRNLPERNAFPKKNHINNVHLDVEKNNNQFELIPKNNFKKSSSTSSILMVI